MANKASKCNQHPVSPLRDYEQITNRSGTRVKSSLDSHVYFARDWWRSSRSACAYGRLTMSSYLVCNVRKSSKPWKERASGGVVLKLRARQALSRAVSASFPDGEWIAVARRVREYRWSDPILTDDRERQAPHSAHWHLYRDGRDETATRERDRLAQACGMSVQWTLKNLMTGTPAHSRRPVASTATPSTSRGMHPS